VGVVGLIGMSHDAIGKRRIDGRRQRLTADHSRFWGASLSLNVSDGKAPGWQHGAGNHRRNGIEDMMPCPGRDVAW